MLQYSWNRMLWAQWVGAILLTTNILVNLGVFGRVMGVYLPYMLLSSPVLVYYSYRETKNVSTKIGQEIPQQKYASYVMLPLSLIVMNIMKTPAGYDMVLFLNTLALVMVLSMMGFSLNYWKRDPILS